MLGIKNYKPNYFTNAIAFLNAHKNKLLSIKGKRIDAYYLQWDLKEDEWNKDGPIILLIDEQQYEFTAFQLDQYSLTINQIDISNPLDWYGAGTEFPLEWRKNPMEEINKVLGKKIEEIYLLEYSMVADITNNEDKKAFFQELTAADYFLVGIEFKLAALKNCLHLSNGLDCNELKIYTTQVDIKNRRVKI